MSIRDKIWLKLDFLSVPKVSVYVCACGVGVYVCGCGCVCVWVSSEVGQRHIFSAVIIYIMDLKKNPACLLISINLKCF